jgi:hypothetical protein
MNKEFRFSIKQQAFDENYCPKDNTRLTTNFANLARGEKRRENLNNAIRMMNNCFNALADWDNPKGDRYALELEIVSVDIAFKEKQNTFPAIEILKTNIVDRIAQERFQGIVGNNFSSYLRDYDFSVLLQKHNADTKQFSVPDGFGELHGKLFQQFVMSDEYKLCFNKPPVICLSVSESKTYHRTENQHPVLGIEYLSEASSLTVQYFERMGLKVRYFLPKNSVAPLAFYFSGDLLNDYTNLELISTISTMDTFQKIYRPEIYNANATAGRCYRPSLRNSDHSITQIVYDREERASLAKKQGRFAEEYFIKPNKAALEQWSLPASQL